MLADRIGVPQLRDMAHRAEQVAADVSLNNLRRLADKLHAQSLARQNRLLTVRGQVIDGAQGFPQIECHVSGILPLTCQRCLNLLEWPVEVDIQLIVVESEAQLDQLIDSFDSVVAGEHGISLAETIESEVLSSLPLAPMHDVGQQCELQVEGLEVVDSEIESGAAVNTPFAGLGALVRQATDTGTSDND
jgi:uncharacterized protein